MRSSIIFTLFGFFKNRFLGVHVDSVLGAEGGVEPGALLVFGSEHEVAVAAVALFEDVFGEFYGERLGEEDLLFRDGVSFVVGVGDYECYGLAVGAGVVAREAWQEGAAVAAEADAHVEELAGGAVLASVKVEDGGWEVAQEEWEAHVICSIALKIS